MSLGASAPILFFAKFTRRIMTKQIYLWRYEYENIKE